MPTQGSKSSFALGTKGCFSPLLHCSLQPSNPEDELKMLVSDFTTIPLPLHENFHFLYGFKTPLTAFNLAADEYLCEPLAEVSWMLEQFITIKPSYL